LKGKEERGNYIVQKQFQKQASCLQPALFLLRFDCLFSLDVLNFFHSKTLLGVVPELLYVLDLPRALVAAFGELSDSHLSLLPP